MSATCWVKLVRISISQFSLSALCRHTCSEEAPPQQGLQLGQAAGLGEAPSPQMGLGGLEEDLNAPAQGVETGGGGKRQALGRGVGDEDRPAE